MRTGGATPGATRRVDIGPRRVAHRVVQGGNKAIKRWLVSAAGSAAVVCLSLSAIAANPGVTDTELKIGNTMPYSGPVSFYSPIGKLDTAFSKMVSISTGSVIPPARVDNAVGLISTGYLKEPTDHQWGNDAGMKEWRTFMEKNMPGADLADNNYVYADAPGAAAVQGRFLARERHEAGRERARSGAADDTAGITASTSPTDHRPIKAMQLERFDSKTWVLFGDIIKAGS